MARFGWFLVIVGFGSLILPVFNLQFKILEPVDAYQPMAGIVVGIVGAALLVWPMIQQRRGPTA